MDQRLKVKPEFLKHLEENKSNTLQDIGVGKEFLNRTSFSQELMLIVDKRGLKT